MNIEIENFVNTGCLGSLGANPTREMVHSVLGPPDTDGYPDHDQYGNIAFEFCNTSRSLYRIMIAYPHPLNDINFGPNDGVWHDPRFTLTPGRFAPETKFRSIVNRLSNFEHADMVGDSPHQICVYANRQTNVDLCFAPPTPLADHTLYCIVSHPQNTNGNNAG